MCHAHIEVICVDDELTKEPEALAADGADAISIVVEFEGLGVATMSARDLAHVLHHARRLADAEGRAEGQGEAPAG